jgi:hypothetical protein
VKQIPETKKLENSNIEFNVHLQRSQLHQQQDLEDKQHTSTSLDWPFNKLLLEFCIQERSKMCYGYSFLAICLSCRLSITMLRAAQGASIRLEAAQCGLARLRGVCWWLRAAWGGSGRLSAAW